MSALNSALVPTKAIVPPVDKFSPVITKVTLPPAVLSTSVTSTEVIFGVGSNSSFQINGPKIDPNLQIEQLELYF